MSEEPLFPKKTDSDAPEEAPGSHVVIERSDDPNFGQTTSQTSSSTQGSLPNVQSRKVGCGSSVFLFMLVGAALAMTARIVLRASAARRS